MFRAILLPLILASAYSSPAGAQAVTYLPGVKNLATFSLLRWNPWAIHVPPRLVPEPAREAFPNFRLPVWRANDHRDLESFRGKIVLLDFWSRSCPACIPTHEALVRNAPAWERFGVQIITVLTGETTEGLDAFFAAHGGTPPFPVLLDPDGKVLASTGRPILPRLDVLDIYGRRAVDRFTGYPQFVELTPLLGTLAAARERDAAH
jgi:peroxiredoxin